MSDEHWAKFKCKLNKLESSCFMDKNKLIDRFAAGEEQRIMLSHLYDLFTRANDRNIITASRFLSETERAAAEGFLRAAGCDRYLFFGGYDGAERQCAVFLPEYLTEDDVRAEPSLCEITYVTASVGKFDRESADISHRDVLGSLMGLGIERDSVGDIIANGEEAVFIIKTRLGGFIRDNLTKISRYPVEATLHDSYRVTPKQDFTTDSDTVASMRLDAVISSVFSVSRGTAAEAVSGGLVSINGVSVSKPDRIVNEGDKLTLRGKGKVIIDTVGGLTKKGRIRFTFKKYSK